MDNHSEYSEIKSTGNPTHIQNVKVDVARQLALTNWLKKNNDDFGPLLKSAYRGSPYVVFDFTENGKDSMSARGCSDLATECKLIFGKIERESAVFGVGLYNEPRACYLGPQFDEGPEKRTIHIGVDLFDGAGQIVLAPLGGAVYSIKDNALPYDYGPTVILEHDIPELETRFWTLYGHLDRQTLAELNVSDPVQKGESIGRLGSEKENGGWVPHLHFQIIYDLMDYEGSGDFPGVVTEAHRDTWTSICPDPNLILGFSEELDYMKR